MELYPKLAGNSEYCEGRNHDQVIINIPKNNQSKSHRNNTREKRRNKKRRKRKENNRWPSRSVAIFVSRSALSTSCAMKLRSTASQEDSSKDADAPAPMAIELCLQYQYAAATSIWLFDPWKEEKKSSSDKILLKPTRGEKRIT